MEITADELRTLILRLCEIASKHGDNATQMIVDIERIAVLNAELKKRRA